MKTFHKHHIICLTLIIFIQLTITAQPNYGLTGFASMNGGITGGEGGVEYYASNYASAGYTNPGEYIYQLLRNHRQTQKTLPDAGIIIYVDTKIDENNFTRNKMDLKDIWNVSVIGVCDLGEFEGVGWTISRASNVIIRNLTIHHVNKGEGTCIEVTTDSRNIWIDRNTFYSAGATDAEYPDKDFYDGLVDIKRKAKYITVSWNIFRDHWKTSLLNHNDDPSLAADSITYHHNLYENLNSRIPLVRHATVHTFNNYFKDVHSSAINCRMNAQVRVENNYFENVGSGIVDTHAGYVQGPVGYWYGSAQPGYWHTSGNILVNSPDDHMESTTTVNIPYSYGSFLDEAEDIPSLVTQYAGAGKILCIDPASDATLSDLTLNSNTIIGFNPEVIQYDVELPIGTVSAPTVGATPSHSQASVVITQAATLPGDATIEVTSENEEENNTYTVSFTLYDPIDDATLADLTVNGTRINGFNRFTTEYSIELPYGTVLIPPLGAVTNWENASRTITNTFELPGISIVEVLAEDQVTTLTYQVSFTIADPSDDAKLEDLLVDNETVTGFSPNTLTYVVSLSDQTTDIPSVSAISSDVNAIAVITQADALPGTATVEVTAEDGTTSITYVIEFNIVSNWKTYEGSVLPNLNNPTFVTSDWDNPEFSVIDDVNDCKPENKLLQLITDPASRKGNWRYNLPSGQTKITIVARVRALSTDYDKAMVIDMQFGGSRERIYINTNDTYWLRHAGAGELNGPNEPLPGDAKSTDWHIYRLTKDGADVKFYFNENPVPVESVVTATSTSNNYFRFGDPFGDQTSGSLLDWLIWDETGAFAPGEGSSIPNWLCTETGTYTNPPLSDDATLADLTINGITIAGFTPGNYNYEVVLPFGTTTGEIPTIGAQTNDEKAEMIINQATTLPGTATVSVTAEDGEATLVYEISFVVEEFLPPTITGISDLTQDKIKVFPNPVGNGHLSVQLNGLSGSTILRMLELNGRIIKERQVNDVNEAGLKVNLPAGMYILQVINKGQIINKKIIIN